MTDEQKPSTSKTDINEREEIVQLWKHLDETLENKAKSMNLSSLNVKSILHHLIKYPNAVDIMMGIRGESDVPNMRMTRSQRKANDNEKTDGNNMSLLCAPKTFLDLNFDDNDEFDEDYAIEKESEEEEEEEEEDEYDEEETEEDEKEEGGETENETTFLDPYDTLDLEDSKNKRYSHENLNELLIRDDYYNIPIMNTSHDEKMRNPEYRDFLNAVRNESQDGVTEDDPDDEDYDVQIDDADLALDVDDWYETRHDRAAQIPRYEVERLMMDTILAEKEIPLPKEVVICKETYVEVKKTQKQKDAEVVERLKQLEPTSSCSLLVKNVTFQQSEIDMIKLQLEQHVQLLTQSVVTCYHDKSLFHLKNQAQTMINELDQRYFDSPRGPDSIYNIPNLAGCIETCHDIINITEVEPKYVKWAENIDGCMGFAPRPEVIAVLSRSNAIRFPNLLPKIQPSIQENYIPFLKSEKIMLAIALLQFGHLPRKSDNTINMDRYSAISQYCLPSRSAVKIRNHMKVIRSVGESSSPIHQIIIQAEQGTLKMEFPPPTVLIIEGTIQNWPPEYQPNWYKTFTKVFKIVGNRVSHLLDSQPQILTTPTKMPIEDVKSKFIQIGTLGETPIILEKSHIFSIAKLMEENREETQLSAPPTPGRQGAEYTEFGMSLDGISELADGIKSQSRMSIRPMTPKPGDGEDSQMTTARDFRFSGQTDFSHVFMDEDEMNLPSTSANILIDRHAQKRKHADMQSAIHCESDDESNKKWRKRSRIEKETMGKLGMDDEKLRMTSRILIARKIMEDAKKRMFMHQEKYSKFQKTMMDKSLSEAQKVRIIVEIFRKMPDLMHLILIFTPIEHLPEEILKSQLRQTYINGIEMMIDINCYISAAKIKSPTVRQIFKLITKIGEIRNTSLEAAEKMKQLLGHERPLWDRIEKYFYSLAYKDRSKHEDFEFIDLTDDKFLDQFDYEIIDDIDSVLKSSKDTTASTFPTNLFVKSGQLMANGKNGIVPVEVREFKWSKDDDMKILSAYNQSILRNSKHPIEHAAKTVLLTNVDSKSIENRLKYLLSIINV